jgi:hypothetical protein|tara:strand:- start:559 stop:828 length:270 start_codon:yes stop_codon:yes gene_type:complete
MDKKMSEIGLMRHLHERNELAAEPECPQRDEILRSFVSIDSLATLDKITMEIRDDAEDALDGCPDDRSALVMIETIERVRTAMGANQLW